MEKILLRFGCSNFGVMADWDNQCIIAQFKHRGRDVQIKASARGYAAAWLKENPWTRRRYTGKEQWERLAIEKGSTAVYSILRDWIKSQVTAIETGILTFEGAFLGQILLPSGKTVLEHVEKSKMIEAPKDARILEVEAE